MIYKCLFKSDKYLPGWTFQLRLIFCWLAAQETIFSTRWDYFKSSGSGVKCTTTPPLGFKYSVQKLHWLIMYVFLFLYQVSQLTESMRRDEQVIFWSLIWSVIRSLIKRFRRCTPSTTRLLTKKINWLTKPCLPSFYTCREKMCHFLRFVNEIEIQKYASISYRLRRN